jgi:hypothetical protein
MNKALEEEIKDDTPFWKAYWRFADWSNKHLTNKNIFWFCISLTIMTVMLLNILPMIK